MNLQNNTSCKVVVVGSKRIKTYIPNRGDIDQHIIKLYFVLPVSVSFFFSLSLCVKTMASLLVNDNINPDDNNNTQLSYIIQIKLKTNKMDIPIIPNLTTLKQLQTNLEEKTGIEIVNQKLLLKGKQLQNVLSADQFLYDINVDKKQNFIKFKKIKNKIIQ